MIKQWLARRLREAAPSYSRSRWLLADGLSEAELGRTAVALYVSYRLYNHVRHTGVVSQVHMTNFLDQVLHEAVRDSPVLRGHCGGAIGAVPRKRKRRS